MRRALIITLIICLFLPLCAAEAEAVALQLFVSPSGDDTGNGTREEPLRTLEAALQRLRTLGGRAPATIWLREGAYTLDAPIEINYRDRANLTLAAWPGEEAVLTGSRLVEGWRTVLLQGEPVWAAPYAGKAPRALYAGDETRLNARWPKMGTLAVTEPAYTTTNKFTNQRSFRVDAALMPDSLEGATVRMLHWWKDELSGVRAYNAQTGQVTMNRPSALTISAGDPVWFENVLGAPLTAGEWAYDAQADMLYYAPMTGERIGDAQLYVGLQERLLTVGEVSGLTLQGITFARTGWSIPNRDSNADFPQAAYDAGTAVYIRTSQDIAIRGCTFRQIGAGAVRIDSNVQNASVTDCLFEDIGAQAIYISGRNIRTSEANRGFAIENNRIDGYGRNFLNAAAILLIHAGQADIRHNEISDGYYTAISGGWVWGGGFNATDALRIENNLIYDIGHSQLDDMGGIYLLGVQPNTVVRGNVVYNVSAATYGGWGIYLDEGASGILVENNLAFRCSSQGFHQHNGTYNTVRNNVFADNLQGQVGISDKRKDGGTFRLEANLLISHDAYIWSKNGIEEIDMGPNLFYTEVSPFVNLLDELFYIADDPDYARVGFVPWTVTAGLL